MNHQAQRDDNDASGWIRVSSFRPYFACLLLAGISCLGLIMIFQSNAWLFLLIACCAVLGSGLLAAKWKVVEKKANHYRVKTLFYSEVVTADEVCMTVKNSGRFWTS